MPYDKKQHFLKVYRENCFVLIRQVVNRPCFVVKNISKTGVGFETEAVLPLEYYFNAKIELGNQESSLFVVLQIVRVEERGDKMFYGSQFVGREKILDFIFDNYDKALGELE